MEVRCLMERLRTRPSSAAGVAEGNWGEPRSVDPTPSRGQKSVVEIDLGLSLLYTSIIGDT